MWAVSVSANNFARYVVGVDFGTLSGRALVVRIGDGAEVGTAVHEYRHGVIDRELPATGQPLPPDWALQDPEDYREVLRRAVPEAIAQAGVDPGHVVGIGVDFTACTVLATTADGTPLCETGGLRGRPHAYPKLWKHHAAQPQADRITELAHARGEPWIPRYGGRISSEWQFAKGLQLLEEDPDAYQRAERWIEATDWITWQLCGSETRNACTAGYKGIYQDGRYPSKDYLAALNPGFADFTAKLAHPILPLGSRAGGLTPLAASWTGLPEGTAVCVGNVDAHVTAPAAQAITPGQMLLVMGTSTCHVLNCETLAEVPGMCGVVDGGIVAGRWGYEAGQSGVGDIFAWYVEQGVPAEYTERAAARGISAHELMTELAAEIPPGGHGLVALDWWSGNRSVLVDHHLSGMMAGLTLATRPPEIYRAAAGVHRLRHPDDRRRFRPFRRSRHRAGDRRWPAQERPAHAAVRGHYRQAAQPDRLGAGARAWCRDPCRCRRGRVPGRARRRRGDGPDRAQRLPAPWCFVGVRRPLRRIHAAARLLRPRRKRGHAPPARHPRPCPDALTFRPAHLPAPPPPCAAFRRLPGDRSRGLTMQGPPTLGGCCPTADLASLSRARQGSNANLWMI